MSLSVDGTWKANVWATTVWLEGVWLEGAQAEEGPPLGGKGDNDGTAGKRKRSIIKPTGLVDRKPEGRRGVEQRVEETREIAAEVAASSQAAPLTARTEIPPIATMSLAEIEQEIGLLLRKHIRTEEDEVMILLLIAASM